jgi:hypothetical protein
MYKQVPTDTAFMFLNRPLIPVATLNDETGSRLQIIIQGDCYLIYQTGTDGNYYHMPMICQEVVEVMKNLPPLGIS